ncbi:MAG: hypothetical protein IKH01_13815 [Prevotella sp.]|nr:hypothetical protein [Prevotella sp.]
MYQENLSYGLFLSDRQLDFLSNYPQGFDRMKCFATFLQLAVKEPTHYEKKEYFVDLTPGQFAISEVELAKLWKCNRKTASKMVDMFHEVGLVSSVPNCRTTVFTVHCLASWYFGNQVIRNAHYSRHPQVEQRIKANHKSQDVANGSIDNETVANGTSAEGSATDGFTSNKNATEDSLKDNSLSLSSTEIDKANIAHQTDGQTIEQRDEYTSKHKAPVSCDNSNEGNGREKELFNDDVEPNTQIEEPLSSSITLTDVTSDSNSPEEELQPSFRLPDKSNADATTTSPTETLPDNAI